MLNDLSWSQLPIEEITLPPPEFTQMRARLSPSYLIKKTEINGRRAFTREGALFIAHRVPMIVWGKRNNCICDIRTLHLVSPCLRGGRLPRYPLGDY
jgi:hypothetical protein